MQASSIILFYLNTGRQLIKMTKTLGGSEPWASLTVLKSNGIPISLANNSNLATTSFCPSSSTQCDDLILAVTYQAQNNTLQCLTFPSGTPTYATLPGDPISGSGLAMIGSQNHSNNSDEIYTYYQSLNGFVHALSTNGVFRAIFKILHYLLP